MGFLGPGEKIKRKTVRPFRRVTGVTGCLNSEKRPDKEAAVPACHPVGCPERGGVKCSLGELPTKLNLEQTMPDATV